MTLRKALQAAYNQTPITRSEVRRHLADDLGFSKNKVDRLMEWRQCSGDVYTMDGKEWEVK